MIYLDNAATTYPKPQMVRESVFRAMTQYGANPGRSGYEMATRTAEKVYRCREDLANLFHTTGAECVAFTLNCTHAINMVIKGLLRAGDHVVVSSLEHNAVMRSLYALKEKGISYTAAQVYPCDNDATVESFRKAIKENTKLIFCLHASNVWGIRLPIERIAALAHAYDIPIAVDCAQSAGILNIDMQEAGIDYLCAPGHKGLYGPTGTGFLITTKGEKLQTIIEGGTGTQSADLAQPNLLPERFESGTINVPGIVGLHAGVQFVKRRGIESIFDHEMSYIQKLYDRLKDRKNIELYTPRPEKKYFAPVLSFNVIGMESETVGRILSEKGIAVRAGLHCAPSAHIAMGTIKKGTVRVSPSAFSHPKEIEEFWKVISKI